MLGTRIHQLKGAFHDAFKAGKTKAERALSKEGDPHDDFLNLQVLSKSILSTLNELGNVKKKDVDATLYAPPEKNEGISKEERIRTEKKFDALRKQVADLKKKLDTIGMLAIFFNMAELLLDKADEVFSEVELKKEAYAAFHQYLDDLSVAIKKHDSFLDKAIEIIKTKKELKTPSLIEAKKIALKAKLDLQQKELEQRHEDFTVASNNLIMSTYNLLGKTSLFNILFGMSVAVLGSLLFVGSVMLFISSASTSLPLSALAAKIGVDLLLSGVGIALGITISTLSAGALIGGSIFAAKGKQHGLSKEAYDVARIAEKQVNILAADLRP